MKKSLVLTVVLVTLLLGAYIGLWLYSAQWFRTEIDRLYAQAPEKGFQFLGSKPVLSGFPFIPEVTYSGGFQTGNMVVAFPESHLRGYPIPGLVMRLSFPRGINLKSDVLDPKIWSADQLNIGLSIPYRIPTEFTLGTITEWQKSGGKIEVKDYTMVKQSLICEGEGLFRLDDKLQPTINFMTTMTGHNEFIEGLKQDNIIDPFAAAIAIGLLGSLSTIDETTGKSAVTLSVTVQNRMLSVGPLQVGQLPEIVWGTHSPPVLRL